MEGIFSIEPEDMAELVRMHSKYLDTGNGIKRHFEAVIPMESTIALKYIKDGKMIGFNIYTKNIRLSGEHKRLEEEVRKWTKKSLVYTADAIVVLPEFRGKMISNALIRRGKEELMIKGARYIVHELWVKKGSIIPAHHAVEAFGKCMDMGRYDDFYKDHYKKGYICSVCGEKCTCSAQLYLSEVGGEFKWTEEI